MLGVLLTKWTIRLALVCYACFLAGRLSGAAARWPLAARWVWTAGCGLFLVHVACAFHFYHGWSHAAAFETTARETEELLGIRFGHGIYFSYVFLAVWLLDVVRMWTVRSRSRQTSGDRAKARIPASSAPSRAGWLVHGYLLFIAVNGAIVFESGVTRWGGILACLVLAGLGARAAYNARLTAWQNAPREAFRESSDKPSECRI